MPEFLFYQVLNNVLFKDHLRVQNLDQTNDFVFDSDLKGPSKLRKVYPNNPILAYLNIDSLKEKIIYLRDIISTSKIHILCIDDTKLDTSFPDRQFNIDGYLFPLFKKDRDSKLGGKIVFCAGRHFCQEVIPF